MADISKIKTPDGTSYNIKDTTSRSGLADKMDKVNPTGSGHFSLNRKANTTIGSNSFAEGYDTTASGDSSHAEGRNTTVSGVYSHAEGYYTTANHKAQHVFGEYNALDDSTALSTLRGNYVEIVGNGTASDSRSNARTLDWSGNEVLSGTIEATGFGTTLDKEVDRGGVQLTQAQYDELVNTGTVDANTTYFITDANNTTASYAAGVTYDNTDSGLTATNVQDAIDEINSITDPLFFTKTYTYTAESIAAGAALNISSKNFGIVDINGYTAFAVSRIGVSDSRLAITTFNSLGVSIVLGVRNVTTAAITNTTFAVRFIYVKSNFLKSL